MGFHTLFFFNGSMIFPQVISRLLVVFLLFIWEHQYHPTCYLWRPRLVVGGNRWLVSLEFQRLKLNKVIQEKSQETMGNTFRNECDTNLLLLRPEDWKYTHQPFKRLVDTIFCIGSFIYIYIYHITLLSWISPSAMTRTAWQLAALAWTMQSSHATSAVLLLHLWQRKRKRHQSQLALFLVGWMGGLSFVSWQIADSILISPQIDPQSFLFVLAKCLNHWSLGEEIQNNFSNDTSNSPTMLNDSMMMAIHQLVNDGHFLGGCQNPGEFTVGFRGIYSFVGFSGICF